VYLLAIISYKLLYRAHVRTITTKTLSTTGPNRARSFVIHLHLWSLVFSDVLAPRQLTPLIRPIGAIVIVFSSVVARKFQSLGPLIIGARLES
jgi:hypothetical protein